VNQIQLDDLRYQLENGLELDRGLIAMLYAMLYAEPYRVCDEINKEVEYRLAEHEIAESKTPVKPYQIPNLPRF
jgi:hypothetical protein